MIISTLISHLQEQQDHCIRIFCQIWNLIHQCPNSTGISFLRVGSFCTQPWTRGAKGSPTREYLDGRWSGCRTVEIGFISFHGRKEVSNTIVCSNLSFLFLTHPVFALLGENFLRRTRRGLLLITIIIFTLKFTFKTKSYFTL